MANPNVSPYLVNIANAINSESYDSKINRLTDIQESKDKTFEQLSWQTPEYYQRREISKNALLSVLQVADEQNVMDKATKRLLSDVISNSTGMNSDIVYNNIGQYTKSITGVDINEKSNFQQFAQGFTSYWNQIEMAKNELQALNYDTDSYAYRKHIERADEEYQKAGAKQFDFSNRSKASAYLIENAGFLAQQATQWLPGVIGGTIGALSSGGIGFKTGFKTGSKVGRAFTMPTMFTLEAGSLARDLRQVVDSEGNHLNPETIKSASYAYATVSSIIENLDVAGAGEIIGQFPVIKSIEALSEGLKQYVLSPTGVAVMASIYSTLSESTEEGVQALFRKLFYDYALSSESNIQGKNFDYTSFSESLGDAVAEGWAEFKGTIGPMALIAPIGGASAYAIYRRADAVSADAKKYSVNKGFPVDVDTFVIGDTKATTDGTTKMENVEPIKFTVDKDGNKVPLTQKDKETIANARVEGIKGLNGIYISGQENAQVSVSELFDALDVIKGETGIDVSGIDTANKTAFVSNSEQLDMIQSQLDSFPMATVERDGDSLKVASLNKNGIPYSYTIRLASEEEIANLKNSVNPTIYNSVSQSILEASESIKLVTSQAVQFLSETFKKSADSILNEVQIRMRTDEDIQNIENTQSEKLQARRELEAGENANKDAQPVGGWVQDVTDELGQRKFTKEGKPIFELNLTKYATENTVIEEVGHLIRGMATKEELAGFVGLEGLTGTSGAMWTSDIRKVGNNFMLGNQVYEKYNDAYNAVVGNEEVFAEMFRRYLANGYAPNAQVKSVFDKIIEFAKKIGSFISGDRYKNAISEEVKNAFNSLISKAENRTGNEIGEGIGGQTFSTGRNLDENSKEFVFDSSDKFGNRVARVSINLIENRYKGAIKAIEGITPTKNPKEYSIIKEAFNKYPRKKISDDISIIYGIGTKKNMPLQKEVVLIRIYDIIEQTSTMMFPRQTGKVLNRLFGLKDNSPKFSEGLSAVTEEGVLVECKFCGKGHLYESLEDIISKSENGIIVTDTSKDDVISIVETFSGNNKSIDYSNHINVVLITDNGPDFVTIAKEKSQEGTLIAKSQPVEEGIDITLQRSSQLISSLLNELPDVKSNNEEAFDFEKYNNSQIVVPNTEELKQYAKDRNSAPLFSVGYHGSYSTFRNFDDSFYTNGARGFGTYITDSDLIASAYGSIIYKVDIPDSGYLEWDNKLSDKDYRKITDELKRIAEENGEDYNYYGIERDSTFGNIYGSLSDVLGSQQLASKRLSQLGYNGVKDTRFSDSTYVIFDSNNANIIGRNNTILFSVGSSEEYFNNDQVKRDIEYAIGYGFYIRPEYAKMAGVEAEVSGKTPDQKDADFLREHASTDKQLIALSKAVSGYTDAVWRDKNNKDNGKYGVQFYWGNFKGVSSKLKTLYSASKKNAQTPEMIDEVRAIVLENPRTYRLAFEESQWRNERAQAVIHNQGKVSSTLSELSNIDTAYDFEHLDERIEFDLKEIEKKNSQAVVDNSLDTEIGGEKSEVFEAQKEVLVKSNENAIRTATERGIYVPREYLIAFKDKEWAQGIISAQDVLEANSFLNDDFAKYETFDEWYSDNVAPQDENLLPPDFKEVYSLAFKLSKQASQQQANRNFITQFTSIDEGMLKLSSMLRDYSKMKKLSDTYFGAFRGLSSKVLFLYSQDETINGKRVKKSTHEQIEEAKRIVIDNPDVYRIAYMNAYLDYSFDSTKLSKDEATKLSTLISKLDKDIADLDVQKSEVLNPSETSITDDTLGELDAEIEQVETEIEETKKEVGSDKNLSQQLEDKDKEIKSVRDELDNIYEVLAKVENDKVAYKSELNKQSELNDKIDKLTKEKNNIQKLYNAIKRRNELANEREAKEARIKSILKMAKFNSETLDVSYKPMLDWVSSLFDRVDRKVEYEIRSNLLAELRNPNVKEDIKATLRGPLEEAREKINRSEMVEIPESARVYFTPAQLQKMENRVSKWTKAELDDLFSRVWMMRNDAQVSYQSKKNAEFNRRIATVRNMLNDATGSNLTSEDIQNGMDVKDYVSSLARWDDSHQGISKALDVIKLSFIKMGRLARMIDGNTEGSTYDFFIRQVYEAQSEEKRNTNKRIADFNSKFEELGLKMSELVKDGYTFNRNGNDVTLNRLQMIGVYVYSKSDIGTNKLTSQKGNALKEKDVVKIRTLLSANEKAFGDFLINEMSGQYSRLSETYEFIYNKQLGKRVNYFPLIALSRVIQDDKAKQAQCDFLCGQNIPAYTDKGFTQSVVPEAEYELDLDVVSGWQKQVSRQEHFLAYAQWVRDAQYLMGNGGYSDLITNKFGLGTTKNIQEYIDFIARKKTDAKEIEQSIAKWIGRLSGAKIVGNATSVIKQLGALGSGVRSETTLKNLFSPDKVNMLNLMKATQILSSTGYAYDTWKEFMYDVAPELYNRQYDEDLQRRLREVDQKNAVSRISGKITEVMSIPLTKVDSWVVETLWTGSFFTQFNELSKTMDIEDAVKESAFRASQYVAETQNTTERMDANFAMREASNGKIWWKLLTAFQSQTMNMLNQLYFDTRIKGKKEAGRIVAGMLFNSICMLLISGAFFKRDDEDDEEKRKRMFQDSFGEILENAVPLVGGEASNWLQGFDNSNLLSGAFKELRDLVTSEDMSEALVNSLVVMGEITGIGSVAIKRMYTAIEEMNAGYLLNTTWGHIVENNR